jgi:hypothetical protein
MSDDSKDPRDVLRHALDKADIAHHEALMAIVDALRRGIEWNSVAMLRMRERAAELMLDRQVTRSALGALDMDGPRSSADELAAIRNVIAGTKEPS